LKTKIKTNSAALLSRLRIGYMDVRALRRGQGQHGTERIRHLPLLSQASRD
jgi:hypothetical protein